MDEVRLIQDAKKGDVTAYNRLVMHYQEVVYNVAYRIMGEPQAAEDATQEAFISAYKAYIQSLSLEADRIKGYVNLNVFENYLTKGSLEEGVFDDLASLIKTFEKYPNIKIIIVSGVAKAASEERSKFWGEDVEYFEKPVDMEKLYVYLASLLPEPGEEAEEANS